MRDNVQAEEVNNCTFSRLYLNEMKTRFTDLHARYALELQLVPSIIENIAL
jgi:hypothetical protein